MNIINLKGKKSSQIAKEYGVTLGRVNQWAQENELPCVSFDNGATVEFYIFDEATEEAFKNRKVNPGPAKTEKPPKVPGKPGRPRKEKPVKTGPKNPVGRPRKNPREAADIGPKNPVGRPRKYPAEALDIVPKSGRGRPRKK